MRSFISTILVLGVFTGVTVAQAAVLCSKKSGVVTVRTEACKKKETQLDPAALGLQGPQGDQGEVGPQGPPAVSANVAADGSIVAQSGGVTVSLLLASPGAFVVHTGTNVVGKTILLTTWATLSDGDNRGAATYLMCGTTSPAVDCSTAGVANDDQTLIVVTTATNNTTGEPHGFNLVVL
jgi:hypothetical protein